jgi:hypothetical protein
MPATSPKIETTPVSQKESPTQFLQIKTLEAQLALYRGFLHEVNNAFAGIGGMAEVLKGSTTLALDSSLDMMAKAANKSTLLQRRIRAFYPPSSSSDMIGSASAIDIDLVSFLKENKDLMELMLPRDGRFAFEFETDKKVVRASAENLWKIISLMLFWARESEAEKFGFKIDAKGDLSLQLLDEPKQSCDKLWPVAMNLAAGSLGAESSLTQKEIILRFG